MTDPVADDETFVESKAKNRYARWQRALQAPGLPTQTRVLGLQDRSRNRVVEQVIAHADRVTLHACLRCPVGPTVPVTRMTGVPTGTWWPP